MCIYACVCVDVCMCICMSVHVGKANMRGLCVCTPVYVSACVRWGGRTCDVAATAAAAPSPWTVKLRGVSCLCVSAAVMDDAASWGRSYLEKRNTHVSPTVVSSCSPFPPPISSPSSSPLRSPLPPPPSCPTHCRPWTRACSWAAFVARIQGAQMMMMTLLLVVVVLC